MLKINPNANLDHYRDVEKILSSDSSKEQRDVALPGQEATITDAPTAEKLESNEKIVKISSSLIGPSSQKSNTNNTQKIRNCWNYIFEHAKSIFLAGAAVCATMAIKTHLTPHGDTQDTYKAVL